MTRKPPIYTSVITYSNQVQSQKRLYPFVVCLKKNTYFLNQLNFTQFSRETKLFLTSQPNSQSGCVIGRTSHASQPVNLCDWQGLSCPPASQLMWLAGPLMPPSQSTCVIGRASHASQPVTCVIGRASHASQPVNLYDWQGLSCLPASQLVWLAGPLMPPSQSLVWLAGPLMDWTQALHFEHVPTTLFWDKYPNLNKWYSLCCKKSYIKSNIELSFQEQFVW